MRKDFICATPLPWNHKNINISQHFKGQVYTKYDALHLMLVIALLPRIPTTFNLTCCIYSLIPAANLAVWLKVINHQTCQHPLQLERGGLFIMKFMNQNIKRFTYMNIFSRHIPLTKDQNTEMWWFTDNYFCSQNGFSLWRTCIAKCVSTEWHLFVANGFIPHKI